VQLVVYLSQQMQVIKLGALQMAPLVYTEQSADQAAIKNQAIDGAHPEKRQLSKKQYGSIQSLDVADDDEKRPGAIAVAWMDAQSDFDAMEHNYDSTTEVTQSHVDGNLVQTVVPNEDEDKLGEIPEEAAASNSGHCTADQ
jgi:hypothetical protein